MNDWKNQIIIGDCKDELVELYEKYGEFVDLVYLDPPFFSGQTYDLVWENGAELSAYDDTGMYTAEYEVDEKKLKEYVDKAMTGVQSGMTGLDTLDIDRKDRIFDKIRKEIEDSKRKELQGSIHQGGNANYIEFMKQRLKEIHRVLKPTGTIFLHCDKHANHHLRKLLDDIFGEKNFINEVIWHYTGGNPPKKAFARKHDNILFYCKGKDYVFNRQFRPISEASMKKYDEIDADGRVYKLVSGKKKYPHPEGIQLDDVWDIPTVNVMAKERLGYKTQKPEALLERIILAASNEGDVVLDPFMGGGPTIAVAERLKRKWIGIDISKRAGLMTIRNLDRYEVSRESYDINFNIVDEFAVMNRMAELVKLPWNEMEDLIRSVLGFVWTPNCKLYGIDGQHIDDENYFLEVKQWKSNVGQQVVEKFYGKMQRRKATKGIVVADGFTKGAIKAEKDFREKVVDITIKEIEDFVREGLI